MGQLFARCTGCERFSRNARGASCGAPSPLAPASSASSGTQPTAPVRASRAGRRCCAPRLAQEAVRVSIVYPPDTDTPQLAAENLIKPAETRAIAAGAKTWRAEDVARCILGGVDRNQFAITPGWEMTWLHRVHSVGRPLLDWHFDRTAARVRKR